MKVVATLPADCVKLAALNVLEANTVAPEVTVTAPRRVTAPTAPVKVTVPAPAVRPRDCAPLSVLLNKMLLLVVARATIVVVVPRVTAPV